MEVQEVTRSEFSKFFDESVVIYNTAEFNDLNSSRIEKVRYLLFKNNKYSYGIIGGIKDSCFSSPFSAPFGGFTGIGKKINIELLENAAHSLITWADQNQIKNITITLPPEFYNNKLVTAQANIFSRLNFKITRFDINHYLELINFNRVYIENIEYNARKNLRIALKSELHFKKCETDKDKENAYEVIKINRKVWGFPLKMSWQQLLETTKVVSVDFFLVENSDGLPVASAVVFHTAPGIIQVIYWGDTTDNRVLKPMNFLSYKIFEYYKYHWFNIVDIGPSTDNSIPNFGLINFKNSIGCDSTSKLTFSKEL